MANSNSFADVINRQNNGQPITIASAGTLHQSFLLGTSAATLTVPNPMSSIDAGEFFPGFSAQARPLVIRAAGTQVGGERYNIDIVSGTGLTPVIATTGSVGLGITADNWLLEVECMWDSASGYLRGIYYGWAGTSQLNQAALVGGGVANLTLSTLQFSVALTILNANANASFALTEFSGEFV